MNSQKAGGSLSEIPALCRMGAVAEVGLCSLRWQIGRHDRRVPACSPSERKLGAGTPHAASRALKAGQELTPKIEEEPDLMRYPIFRPFFWRLPDMHGQQRTVQRLMPNDVHNFFNMKGPADSSDFYRI